LDISIAVPDDSPVSISYDLKSADDLDTYLLKINDLDPIRRDHSWVADMKGKKMA
jgi:hypothetical protein